MFNRRQSKSVGLPPGTPIFTGIQKEKQLVTQLIEFDEVSFSEELIDDIEDLVTRLNSTDKNIWLNVVGLHDVDYISELGRKLNIDSLLVEDIVNTSQRAKIEDMGDYFFIVIKDLNFSAEDKHVYSEHMALIVSSNYIITFQENLGDNYNGIRDRLRKNLGLIRKRGIDYLFNRLVDASVDNYFLVIHELGELIEDLEDIVVTDPSQETLENIQDLKKEAIKVRRIVIPVREVVGILLKVETIVISPQTLVFVRSIYDHLIQIVDSIELHREMLSSFLDIYLSSLSNKTNDVMKVLTIVTSVFIPLSFLAGVYGMNFQNMPELTWKYGYFFLWLVMMAISSGLLYYFKRKDWI